MTNLTEFIPVSPGRVSMKALAELLDVSERDVRRYVLKERLEGELIGADEDGYFIPCNSAEMTVYYMTARARALTTLASLKVVRRKLKEAGVDLNVIEGRADGEQEKEICSKEL